jgi:integrase
MNFIDIIHLKRENVTKDMIFFIREKTKRSRKKDLRPIKVGINPRAQEIIDRYQTKDLTNPYLFPILEPNLSAVTIKSRCHNLVKWVNKHMEVVRKEIGIEIHLGTYAARHSFSTVLKRKGIPTSYIKEALGHSSEAVTENYLDSFTDDVKLKNSTLLTDL